MVKIPTLVDMLKAGVHFGHRTSRWHPNMEPYIFTDRGGVHIIDLEKTQKKLEETGEFLKALAMEGGALLFVGTKKQAQKLIEEKAKECDMPYVNQRWIGGTLTNFNTIRGRVKHYLDLIKKRDSGELEKYTKKEQLNFAKEIADLDVKVGGLANLDKLPNAIFILDLKTEKTALREAKRRGIKIIAVCDTNINPFGIDYVIPANDDALKSIEIMINFVADAFKEGKALEVPREQMKKLEENHSFRKVTNDVGKQKEKVEVVKKSVTKERLTEKSTSKKIKPKKEKTIKKSNEDLQSKEAENKKEKNNLVTSN